MKPEIVQLFTVGLEVRSHDVLNYSLFFLHFRFSLQ
jgi:hypothetical protein